jgi:uncharacterized protein
LYSFQSHHPPCDKTLGGFSFFKHRFYLFRPGGLVSLKEQITADMKDAMRAKDAERLGTIRLLLAAIKQKEVDERILVDDPQTVVIIEKLLKQRKDSVTAFDAANRKDLADKERAEIVVLSGYMPAQLSSAEISTVIDTALASLKAANPAAAGGALMGQLMAAVKPLLAGKADMSAVSALVKQALSK